MKSHTLFFTLITIFCFTVNAQITSYPYVEDFESEAGGWTLNGTTTTWELGTPTGTIINSAASGSNAWVTNLDGVYAPSEDGWVQSPVFDLSPLTDPEIQLNLIVDSENSWDGLVIQYSVDSAVTWENVGAFGDPDNWYNDNTINGLTDISGGEGWTGEGSGWITAKHSLSSLIGQMNVIFRMVFGSDASVHKEGVGFDLIQILERPLSINDFETINFNYFPNPTSNRLTLKSKHNMQNVTVYNMLGQKVIETPPEALECDINMSSLQSGTYFVKVTIDNLSETIRIIKQ